MNKCNEWECKNNKSGVCNIDECYKEEFNVTAECDSCRKRKENCTENIIKEDGEIKVEFICKECYEERQK